MKRFVHILFNAVIWIRIVGLLLGLGGLIWQGATYSQVISGKVGSLKEFAGVMIGGFVYENVAAYAYVFSGAVFVPAVLIWTVFTLQSLRTAATRPVFGPWQALGLLTIPAVLDYAFDTFFFQFLSLVGFLFLLYEIHTQSGVLAEQTALEKKEKEKDQPKTYFGWKRPTRPTRTLLVTMLTSFVIMVGTGFLYAAQAAEAIGEESTISQAQAAVHWAIVSDVFELVFVAAFLLFTGVVRRILKAKDA